MHSDFCSRLAPDVECEYVNSKCHHLLFSMTLGSCLSLRFTCLNSLASGIMLYDRDYTMENIALGINKKIYQKNK